MSRFALLGLLLVIGCYESRFVGDPVDDAGIRRDTTSDVGDADRGDVDISDGDPGDGDPRDTDPRDSDVAMDTDVADADAPDTFRPPPPPTCRVTTTPLPRCTAQAEQCLVECSEGGPLDEECATRCHESVDECLDCRLAERYRCLEDFVCIDELRTYMCCLRDCGTSRPPLLRNDEAAECAARECPALEDALNTCLIGRPEVANACESRALRVCGFR